MPFDAALEVEDDELGLDVLLQYVWHSQI